MAGRRWRLVPIVVVLLLAAATTSARAIGAFGAPVGVDDPPCEFEAFNADAAQDSAGVAHGFTNLWAAPAARIRSSTTSRAPGAAGPSRSPRTAAS
jgi:hypothetical protein